MAWAVVAEIAQAQIPVAICLAPEFYGPGKTQSITNSLTLEPLKNGKRPRVPVRADTLRTLIWTPDVSRAMALIGNTPDAFGCTWHLPCDDASLTYRQFACVVMGRPFSYTVLHTFTLDVLGLFSKQIREIKELLSRYKHDTMFDSSAFKRRFPQFKVTTYREGLTLFAGEQAKG